MKRACHALALHGQGMDFANALHLLRSEGCSALVSLDRALGRAASRPPRSPRCNF